MPLARIVSCGVAALIIVGCASSPIVMAGEGGLVVTANAPTIEAEASMAPAFDPRLDEFRSFALGFVTRNATGASCSIELSREGVALVALDPTVAPGSCRAEWDGRDDGGALLEPGPVDVIATVERNGQSAMARARVEIVHLGVREVRLGGEGREALLYARMGGTRYGYYELAADTVPWRIGPDGREPPGGNALALADGTARVRPAPWSDPLSPPLDDASPDGRERDTFNLPTAWVAGAAPDITVVLSTGDTDPSEVEVRVVAPEGLSLLDEGAVSEGGEASFESAASPVPAVGRYDVTWRWRFEARAPGGEWAPIEGSFATTHRFYGLVGTPIFDYPDVPHRAWIDVVDRVAGWVGGESSNGDAVASRIVEGVFYELGLQYDNVAGASHYTDYPGGWEGASFELSRFTDLASGTIINCSDAASVVSTYSNMVGIDLRYHIIEHQWLDRFELNYLYAIGRGFAASPFLSGRSAFRYHAVVGPPDTRIFDATLAIDGDGTPSAPPHELLLVQGLSEMDYLVGLSPEWNDVNVFVDEKVRVR